MRSRIADVFGGIGSNVFMDYTVIGTSVASIDTANIIPGGLIPQIGKNLWIMISSFGTTAAVRTAHYLNVNNDTGANYYDVFSVVGNSTISGDKDLANTKAYLGDITAASGSANFFTPTVIEILDYTSATKQLSYLWRSFAYDSGSAVNMNYVFGGGSYSGTVAPLTRLKFAPSAGNYDLRTRIVMGVN